MIKGVIIICLLLACIFPFTKELSSFVEEKLQDNKRVSVFDFGAKGDGQHDDGPALEKAIYYCVKNKKVCFIPKTKNFYNIRSTVRITLNPGEHAKIYSDGAVLRPLSTPINKSAYNLTSFREHIMLSIGNTINSIKKKEMFARSDNTGITISGLTFDGQHLPGILAAGDHSTDIMVGLQALANSVVVDGCVFTNIYGYGLRVHNVLNASIKNTKFVNVGGRGATPYAQQIDMDGIGDGIYFALVKTKGNINIQNCVLEGMKRQNKRSRSAITFEYSTEPYNIRISNVNISGFAKGLHIEETAPTDVLLEGVKMEDFNFGIANVLNDRSVVYLKKVSMNVGFSDGNDNGDALAFLNYESKAKIYVYDSHLSFKGKANAYQSAVGLVKVENSTINGNNTNFFFADGNTWFNHCTFENFGGAGKSFSSDSGNSLYRLTDCTMKRSKAVHAKGQRLELVMERVKKVKD